MLVACCTALSSSALSSSAVQYATSTHTPQDRHLATLRTPYAAFVKEIVTSIAPEDGHISPKHVELKYTNKYSIASSW